jgi:hypothetical protein
VEFSPNHSDKVLPWNVLQTDRPDLRDAGTPVLDQNRELTLAVLQLSAGNS